MFKIEPVLRYIHSLLYIGNKHQCNICGRKLKCFIETPGRLICPACGSIQRNRRLWQILNRGYVEDGISILDFSPSRSLFRALKKSNIAYTASDLSGDFIADVRYDITNISAEDQSFDLVICYHILEHVIEDTAAMKELQRVLKDDGFCFIQTPFKDGNIYEDYSIISPEDRLAHFGQEDHVRIYSVEGLKQRLTDCGFTVEILVFNEDAGNYHGFDFEETVLLCRK